MWLYLEDSISLAALEEFQWPSENLSEQSHTAKLNHTAKVCSSPEWLTEFWTMPQFGTISKLSTEDNLKEKLISSMEGSPVPISVLQELEEAWKESEADYFSKSCAWPTKSSPSSYYLKMSPQLPQEADFKSLLKLPKEGMIVDGVLYPLRKLERNIREKDSSYWPTPTTQETEHNNLTLKNGRRVSKTGTTHSLNLVDTITLTQMWPTLKASDAKRGDSPCERRRHSPDLKASINIYLGTTGKQMSLKWLEWLMGYNFGHTELSPLETQSCPSKLEKLFASCREFKKKNSVGNNL